MEHFDYWRLCDELNVVQAAFLIVGEDPHSIFLSDEGIKMKHVPSGYEAAKTAITHAVKRYAVLMSEMDKETRNSPQGVLVPISERIKSLRETALKGTLVPIWETDNKGKRTLIPGSIDLWHSTVEVAALREWLKKRGISSGFFFPVSGDAPDYLDPNNSRYAPKLAAAVRAWEAVTDPGKKSPKQALDKWLREHAAEFGLTDEDGNPVNQAIEECSKVANWNTSGGAPKTPS